MLESIPALLFSFILNLDISNSLANITQNLVLTNTILAFKHCALINLFLLHYYTTYSLEYFSLIRVYSLGFLLADTLYFYVYYKIPHWKLYLVHHSIFILAWYLIEYQPIHIYSYFNRMLLAELSGMTLNMRHLAKHYKYTKLDIMMSLLTYILFFLFRIVNFTQMIGVCYQEQNIIFSILLVPITSMQYYWFYLMSIKFYKYIYPSKNIKNE